MHKIKIIFLLFLVLRTQAVFAAQFIEVSEGSEHKVNISSYELNRIKIQGAKIEGFRALEGDVTASPDKEKGELFIHLPKKYSKKVTNIFVTSSSGSTFKLMLVPKNIPAEQVFLVERNATDEMLKISDQYRDEIISFYKQLYLGKTMHGYSVSTKREKYKKEKLKITKIISYENDAKAGLYGEVFEIKNTAKKPVMLQPHEFYQEGVRAVKLDSHILGKDQTTKMYIISIRG
ncbi:type-F conjugative transfer system secretin TraK [Rickettsiales bacterium]|nr:type-F conjugative transfer system secretin TraK [Rickettsiales bacterium]